MNYNRVKFYLINMKKDVEKLEWCKRTIGDRFEFQVFEAIEDINEADFKKLSFQTKSEYGCFLSHMKVLEMADKESDSFDTVIIMEDDISFVENFDKYFPIVISQLAKTDYDVCLFYDWQTPDSEGEEITLRKTDSLYLHFYAINPKSIGKFMFNGHKFSFPLDSMLKQESKLGNIKALSTSKVLVKQNRYFGSGLTGYGFRGEINHVIDCVYPYDDLYKEETPILGKWKFYKANFRDIFHFFIDGSITSEKSKLTGGRWRIIHNEIIITFNQPEVFEIIYLRANKVYTKMSGESWDTQKMFVIKEKD